MTEKVIRDGKVAVLVSPGYGAGWSTWADNSEEAVFSPEIVAWVEDGKPPLDAATEERWEDTYGYYLGGLADVGVEWLDQGTRFEINEYDGSESLYVITPDYGYVA
jgi:hypothetical protein